MPNGEGYIKSRSKGSHTITIYLGKDENGKARQHVETFRGSEKDAKSHMARLIAERDKGVDLNPQQATFEELVQRWRDSHYPDLAQNRRHLRDAPLCARAPDPREHPTP